MRPLLVWCGLAMLLAFSACDTSHEDPLPPLVPHIQEGDMWIMMTEVKLGSNFPEPPLIESTKLDTFSVLATKVVNGHTWFNIQNREGYGLFTLFGGLESYYSIREDGIWQLGHEDAEIHLIRYPTEENFEYEIIEGMFSSLVNQDTLYTLAELGAIPAIKFRNRYSTTFKPFNSERNREEFQPLPLERELIKSTYFSSELGVLRREMFYVNVLSETDEANIAGSQTWDLLEYIPAGGR